MSKIDELKFSGNWRENLDRTNCVYLITNNVNNKKYVGMTKLLSQRLRDYRLEIKSNCGKKRLIIKAIKKYGEDKFSFDFIKQCHSYEEAQTSEIELIKFHKENNYIMYNQTIGGEGAIGAKIPTGTETKQSKLTLDDIANMFKLYHKDGLSSYELEKIFKIDNGSIRKVLNGETYKSESEKYINLYGKVRKNYIEMGSNKRSGVAHYKSKVNEENIENIFFMFHNCNLDIATIANKFSISYNIVFGVLTGKTYKKITNKLINSYPKIESCRKIFNLKNNRGELSSSAKLTKKNVLDILYEYHIEKNKIINIAKTYNVSLSTIYKICDGSCWSDTYKEFALKYDIQIRSQNTK